MTKSDFIAGAGFTIDSKIDLSVYHYRPGCNMLSRNNFIYIEIESISDRGFLAVVNMLGKRRSAWVNFKELKLVV